MWTPAERALVGDFGSGQALTNHQLRTVARPPGWRAGEVMPFDEALEFIATKGFFWIQAS